MIVDCNEISRRVAKKHIFFATSRQKRRRFLFERRSGLVVRCVPDVDVYASDFGADYRAEGSSHYLLIAPGLRTRSGDDRIIKKTGRRVEYATSADKQAYHVG